MLSIQLTISPQKKRQNIVLLTKAIYLDIQSQSGKEAAMRNIVDKNLYSLLKILEWGI